MGSVRRDLPGYWLAAFAGVVSFVGLLGIFVILLMAYGTYFSLSDTLNVFIFVVPAVVSGALSAFIARPHIQKLRDASILGGFAAALYGGLFFTLYLLVAFVVAGGGQSNPALNIAGLLQCIFILVGFESFFAMIGAVAGIVVSKLLFFRTKGIAVAIK